MRIRDGEGYFFGRRTLTRIGLPERRPTTSLAHGTRTSGTVIVIKNNNINNYGNNNNETNDVYLFDCLQKLSPRWGRIFWEHKIYSTMRSKRLFVYCQ